MRFVNRGNKTLTFRIEQFKFDVPEGAKANAKGAAFDGDPASYYTVKKAETFVSPGKAKNAIVLADVPAKNITKTQDGANLKVTVKAGKSGEANVFEIVWK